MHWLHHFLLAALTATFFTADARASADIQVKDLATAFARFHAATAGQPTDLRVAAFKRDLAPLFPEFYGVARFRGKITQDRQDGRIATAIEQFDGIRDAYAEAVERFSSDQARHSKLFLDTFPDFTLNVPVVLLHSLGEMDGGTRELAGNRVLVFGADVMARVHRGWRSEAAFFHHELFHVYHEPRLGECEVIWCSLWAEGLAVYVAANLNPEASHAELLLDVPSGMVAATQAALVPSLESLHAVLDSEDMASYADLFLGDANGQTSLPRRRGYYLGYLVAAEIARSHSLREMATMKAIQAQPLVRRAIEHLLATARTTRSAGQ